MKVTKEFLGKNSPTILVSIGVAGMVTAVGMAIKVTPSAITARENAEKKAGGDISKKQRYKILARCYVPVVAVCVFSGACIFKAHSINVKRNLALAGAYKFSEETLQTYQKKVIEKIGEEAETAISNSVNKERMEKSNADFNLAPGEDGDVICFDIMSGRTFRSNSLKLGRIENVLTNRLMSEMYISLNDFYYEVGLPSIKLGDSMGWSVDEGYICLSLGSQLDDNDQPVLTVDFDVHPRPRY